MLIFCRIYVIYLASAIIVDTGVFQIEKKKKKTS